MDHRVVIDGQSTPAVGMEPEVQTLSVMGDYFRVTRGYSLEEMDPADRATTNSTEYDDTQKKPQRLPVKKYGELPRRVLGEVVILNCLPTTATAMVTFMLEEMHPGDMVDMEPAGRTSTGGGCH